MAHGRFVVILIDFIPIILVYLFASQPKEMIAFSDSSLGRFCALSIILFYSAISPIYGFFICALIILYYQADMREHWLNKEHNIRFEEGLMNLTYELFNGPETPNTPFPEPQSVDAPSSFGFYQSGDSGVYHYVPFRTANENNEDKFDRQMPASIDPTIAKSAHHIRESFSPERSLLSLEKADTTIFPWK